jgi:predicted DNA-binding antitoxin AbrB/MazE fold protein
MEVEVNAVYEGGVLKLERPLELPEKTKVRVIVKVSRVQLASGLLGFKGDPEIIRRIALEPEFGIEEAP